MRRKKNFSRGRSTRPGLEGGDEQRRIIDAWWRSKGTHGPATRRGRRRAGHAARAIASPDGRREAAHPPDQLFEDALHDVDVIREDFVELLPRYEQEPRRFQGLGAGQPWLIVEESPDSR